MSDAKCAQMLLEAAKRDIEALRVMRRNDGLPDEIYGFHVQQAAEKLLKSWIALLGESYPLTHSIETLLKLLADRASTRRRSWTSAPTRPMRSSSATRASDPTPSRSIALERLKRSKRCWSESEAHCRRAEDNDRRRGTQRTTDGADGCLAIG